MYPAHPAYMDVRPGWDVDAFMVKARAPKKPKPKPKGTARGGKRR